MAAARRICVIGNSSVGAVRMALGDRPAPSGYEFAFFASGGPKFETIGIADDLLVGAEVDSGGDRRLSTYDGFVLHGRLPAAFEALEFERGLGSERYSERVRALALADWREGYKSWALGLSLCARYGRPVLAMSRNVFASERAGSRAERATADATLARLLTPISYAPFPDALFDEDGSVKRPFYARYVNVHGREGSAASQDEWHYNREAGGLILDALLSRLDAAFASD